MAFPVNFPSRSQHISSPAKVLKRKSDEIEDKVELIVKKQKSGRTVFSPSKAPTTADAYPLEKILPQHAYQRIQAFYVVLLYYKDAAVRSDGSSFDFEVKIGRSRKQVGQCHDGNHASHFNAASGVEDNWMDKKISHITSEGKITPSALKVLKRIGVPDEEIQKIQKNYQKAKETLQKFQGKYLFEGLEADILLNGTDNLPVWVNLGRDKLIETRRDWMARLYKRVAKGEIDPLKGTQKYQKKIIRLLESDNKELAQKLLLSPTDERIKRCLEANLLQLKGTKEVDFDLLQKFYDPKPLSFD